MKKKTVIPIIIVVLLVITAVLIFLRFRGDRAPYIVSASDVTADGAEDIVSVDVTVNKLGEEIYPAASFSIKFDSAHLEFIELKEGSLEVMSPSGAKLPSWCCNVEKSNELGVINVMYLDITGGTEAFYQSITGDDSVIFRLSFRVRGNASAGDVYPIEFDDAVFAANDESHSIALSKGTLFAKSGSIKIGG